MPFSDDEPQQALKIQFCNDRLVGHMIDTEEGSIKELRVQICVEQNNTDVDLVQSSAQGIAMIVIFWLIKRQ